jgi:hypothetical protein
LKMWGKGVPFLIRTRSLTGLLFRSKSFGLGKMKGLNGHYVEFFCFANSAENPQLLFFFIIFATKSKTSSL